MATRDVWVLLEAEDKKIKTPSLGLMDEGERLSTRLGGRLQAVMFGERIDGIEQTVGHHGVDHLHIFHHESLRQYAPDLYAELLAGLLSNKEPHLFLGAATSLGADLIPRVASRLGAPVVTQCVEINFENELEFIKPVQNGRLHATLRCKTSGIKMATINPNVLFVLEEKKRAKMATVTEIKPEIPEIREGQAAVRATGFLKADHRTIDINEAEVIVAVGRGVGISENFKKVEEFADRIEGAIAGTRPMVDMGLLPFERQIGQTGKIVSPKLVVLCGISGAMEFSKGIETAETKIAINIDRQAPIFKSVDLGIVSDLSTFIPQMIRRIDQKRQPGEK